MQAPETWRDRQGDRTMRLTMMSLSLVFVLISASAQQPAALKRPQPAKAMSVDAPGGHARVATRRAHHRAARKVQAVHRKGAKRRVYRREYNQNSVEVMNGASTQKVVFHDSEPASGRGKDRLPAPLKVEVVNGTSTDTQYFAAGQAVQQNRSEAHPVVVAIQSSDTRVVGGNKHPVVTGITAVEPGRAKSASGGQTVMTGISPRPKRPEYKPDNH
jgi:hypothetical protein